MPLPYVTTSLSRGEELQVPTTEGVNASQSPRFAELVRGTQSSTTVDNILVSSARLDAKHRHLDLKKSCPSLGPADHLSQSFQLSTLWQKDFSLSEGASSHHEDILGNLMFPALDTDHLGVLTEASSPPQDYGRLANPPEGGLPPEKLQELLWFFRTEDPSAWNFSILGLSFLVLLSGIMLLGTNIRANRTRKLLLLHQKDDEVGQAAKAEAKQALMLLKRENSDTPGEGLFPKAPNAGEVMISWKDGKTTTLYANANEEEA